MEEREKRQSSLISRVPNPCGRPPIFKTAEDLWGKFIEYCDYIDSNPWQIKSASNSLSDNNSNNHNSMRQEVRVVQRAYTLMGFCAFAGIATSWSAFKMYNKQRNAKMANTINQIENVVVSQQVDGALVNQFNGNLVARLNGIVDVQETKMYGEFSFPKLSKEDLDELKKINGF